MLMSHERETVIVWSIFDTNNNKKRKTNGFIDYNQWKYYFVFILYCEILFEFQLSDQKQEKQANRSIMRLAKLEETSTVYSKVHITTQCRSIATNWDQNRCLWLIYSSSWL